MSHPVDKDILSALSGSNENSETENTAKNVESRYSVVIASANARRYMGIEFFCFFFLPFLLEDLVVPNPNILGIRASPGA